MIDGENISARGTLSIPTELAREIARQGEIRLIAIASLGAAADSRATTLCGIFVASSAATAGVVLANLVSNHPVLSLIVAGAVISLGLFMAAMIVAHALAPRDFFIAAGNPEILREWSWDNNGWRTEAQMLDATGCRYAQSIADDQRLLKIGSRRVKAALWVACASLPIAISAFIAAIFL
jgi:hypothetical protein